MKAVVPFILAVSVGFGIVPAVRAMEGGQSVNLKGYRDFSSGVLPPPGLQLRTDLNVYSGSENSRIPAGQLAVGLRSYSSILGLTVVTPLKLWGGDYGFSIRGAVTHGSADRTIFGTRTTSVSGELTGFNDIVVTPFVLGWQARNWHWNVATTVWAPAGRYDASRLVNTGRNFWSWGTQAAITYRDREAGWEVSGAAAYIISFENPTTNYDSGDMVHLDFSALKRVAPGLSIGAVGYVMTQVTGDSGAGNRLGDRKAEVFGIGPGMTIVVRGGDEPVLLTAKYYREFSARNTTQGDAGAISLRVHF